MATRLKDIDAVVVGMGFSGAILARELTKKFEEYLRGTAAELLEVIRGRAVKGEFVVMVEGKV